MLAWLAVLLLGLAHTAQGAEIDSLTAREQKLGNARPELNERLNGILRDGIEHANERGEGCDSGELYRALRRAASTPFIGHAIAERLNQDERIDSRRVRFHASIYRDIGLLDAISVHVKDLSAVLRVDEHVVGTDKFGHFLVEGWKYFEFAYLDAEGVENALRWGERAERTYFGLLTTGVYSFADLAVNFEGMRFWLRVLGQQQDPLSAGWLANRSYVRCSRQWWNGERYWRLRRRADLRDYVGGAWDEGVNCVRFRNEELASAVRRRVQDLEVQAGQSRTCPIDPGACAAARERYGPYAQALLHPACAGAVRPPNLWQRFWSGDSGRITR